jgi:hypothetical protein
MALNLLFVADERTAKITPDAFRVRLEQSRFNVKSRRAERDEVELEVDGGIVLWLVVEGGYVTEIEAQVTFASDRKSNLLLELIESMGWVQAEV